MLNPAKPNAINRQITLKSRPSGEPKVIDFALVEKPVPTPGKREVLCRTLYLSLDPYMRDRMSDGPSYATPTALNDVMGGATVSQVITSDNPHFTEGDFVLGYDGWQEYGLSDAQSLRKLDPNQGRLSYALGILGMPGLTAYAALLDIGRPKAGETVVVSAAAGAVGSVVGQIAKVHGCRAVGLAGSDDKCRFVVAELGFDACVNYKTDDLAGDLRAACPNGIDIYYDNVAGKILETVLGQINHGARIPLVGLISQYNAETPPPGPNLAPLLVKRALIHGFLVSDYQDRQDAFLADMSQWLNAGKMTYREDIVQGLENAPEAFLGLFSGRNFGKLLVEVSLDPTAR